MTIIAFRDGIMCADSLTETSSSFRRGQTNKIVRSPEGFIVGATGPAGACASFLRWALATKGHDPGYLCAADEFEGIVAYEDGRVAYYDGAGDCPDFLRAPFHAIGSEAAMGVAIGVMAEGGTAKRAVERAIEWTTCCGPPILTLKLGNLRKWKARR